MSKKQNKTRLIILIIILVLSIGLLFYVVRSSPKNYKNVTFTETLPAGTTLEEESEMIVVYGDSRSGHEIHRKIIAEIQKKKPIAVFHTGDLVNNGEDLTDWNIFNDITLDLRNTTDFYPALGNHEKNAYRYYENFELPNNEQWYSVEFDNIHFIVLDTNTNLDIDSEQYSWLENDLKKKEDGIEFTAVIFHHPIYNTGSHEEDEKGLKESVVPLFEENDIDIVFSGHEHNYERSINNEVY
ncbi:metallophosphoesterase [Candidatus Dojkabacteria bacterium]|nr:metallophosphoesterase [Candidatus Dojkabacteria bacterium]